MAAPKILTLDDFRNHGKEPYIVEIEGLGAVKVRKLTHAQVKMLSEKYIGADGTIAQFQALREEVLLLGVVEPSLTPEDLEGFVDDANAIHTLYLRIGQDSGFLVKEAPPPAAPATTGNAAS